jgi:ABC-type uncharacterized transport system ATPase subunit
MPLVLQNTRKLMLIGEPKAGKSSLLRCLKPKRGKLAGSAIRFASSRTEMVYNIQFSPESRALFHAMSLSGTDCFNGSHRMFMTFPCIYLVVCNVDVQSPWVCCTLLAQS